MDRVDMPNTDTTKHMFPSATWEFRKVKIATGSHPQGNGAASPKEGTFRRKRDRHKPINVTIRYVGGAESSWLISWRGLVWRFPGHLALEDLMTYIEGEQPLWLR